MSESSLKLCSDDFFICPMHQFHLDISKTLTFDTLRPALLEVKGRGDALLYVSDGGGGMHTD